MITNNILVLTTWAFKDGLIQSFTLPYLKIIKEISPNAEITLITSEQENYKIEPVDNLTIIPFSQKKFGIKKLIQWPYQIYKLIKIIKQKQINIIHCFCTPAGTTGYILSKLTGSKLIIDSYEPHSESMVENGAWKKKSFAFKILWLFEKLQTKHAFYIISATQGMYEYARKKYNFAIKNFVVKPACVDLNHFNFNNEIRNNYRDKLKLDDKIVCVYAGKFGGIYLDKEVFDFFASAVNKWGAKFRILLLTAEPRPSIEAMAQAANINPAIIISIKAAFTDVPAYMQAADFGITPVKPVPSKRYCTPIKDGEYWAIGLPVVITKNISDDSDIIANNNIGAIIESLDSKGYLKALDNLDILLNEDKENLRNRIINIARKYRSYNIAYDAYKKVYGN